MQRRNPNLGRKRSPGRSERIEAKARYHRDWVQKLDRARALFGSDTQAAKQLGTTSQVIGDVRAGRKPMPVILAVKLAKAFELDTFSAMCAAMSANSRSRTARHFWIEYGHDLWITRHRAKNIIGDSRYLDTLDK